MPQFFFLRKLKFVDKYRFSDLAGRLKWKGDAAAEQCAIRDEWKALQLLVERFAGYFKSTL
ncbi:MAG: hypothetical protein KAW12_22820 [Candidatus Aminicenantes bacterium]|nr:hypothetical protein [Candidatus Aminicenantes bacterium]